MLKNYIKTTKSNYILRHLFFSIFRGKLALLVLKQRFSKVLLLIYIEFNWYIWLKTDVSGYIIKLIDYKNK